MNVAGIVAEYNPFHNGHLYHLREAKRLTQADCIVCVMSGHFLQRGEPALTDKWSRAAMAVAAGADVVIELPYVYSGQSAETFAYGAVSLLNATGVVTHLCFGSECTDLSLLQSIIPILVDEPEEYQQQLKGALSTGLSFPAARQRALSQYLKNSSTCLQPENMIKQLLQPNSILGIEYLKALSKINSSIKPVLIPRTGSAYHDALLKKGSRIASATAIRTSLYQNQQLELKTRLHMIKPYLPDTSLQILRQCLQQGRGPVFAEHFGGLLNYSLRLHSPEKLADTADVREGIEYKISAAAKNYSSWEELLLNVKSKRFPRTTLQRIMIQILLNYSKGDATAVSAAGPLYLRLLSFSPKGQEWLRIMKEKAALPLIHRLAPFEKSLAQSAPTAKALTCRRMLALDRLATDIYVLAFPTHALKTRGQDYTVQLQKYIAHRRT